MHELKKSIDERKIVFGIKQILKSNDLIGKAMVSKDCREHIKNLLKANKINIDMLDFSKEEIANRLELGFKCEVFGLKK